MSLINFLLRRKPKVVLRLKGTSSFISERNEYPTSDSIVTNSIYFAREYSTIDIANKVLDTIDLSRERYLIVIENPICNI